MALEISNVSGLGSVVKSYLFEILLTDPPGGDGSDFALKVNSTVLPSGITYEPIEIPEGGTVLKEAGRAIPPRTWTVECREFEDAGVLDLLQAWRNVIYNPETGLRGSPSDYKTDAYLKLKKSDGTTYKTAKIFGIWPETVDDATLDKATSDMLRIPVTFSYDDVVYE
jgi:hypothetical protein